MKLTMRLAWLAFILVLAFPATLLAGTTGKISGMVTEKASGQALPGVNVVVVGTTLGAATNPDGQYTILDLPPAIYRLQVTLIGYRKVIVEDVHVAIDQTARVNVIMEAEAVEAPEVVVTAERKLIRPDVATSVVSATSDQVQALPNANVVSVLGLQAGISGGWNGAFGYAAQPLFLSNYVQGKTQVGGGISIRGGGSDGILFNVDGVTLRDPRNNEPDTKLALSSVQNITVERGGFNAEYGQVTSGVVNVVTKEGEKDVYSGRAQVRISPPAAKYWLAPGITDLNNPMSYALRPFFDPAVCWTGTGNGSGRSPSSGSPLPPWRSPRQSWGAARGYRLRRFCACLPAAQPGAGMARTGTDRLPPSIPASARGRSSSSW